MGQTTNLQATAKEFLDAAELLLANGDFAQAESSVNACLKLVPGDKRALAMLDRILRKDAIAFGGEHDAILESVSSEASGPFTAGSGARHGRFLPHDVPDDGKEEAISLARRHESAENWSLAANAWLEVLNADPSDTWAWTQYAHLLSVNLKDYGKAEDAYRKALDIDPTDDWAWGKLGIMLADFSGMVSEGQEMLRRAMELDATEAYYKAWLGWSLHYQSNESVEAEKYLSEAVKLFPSYQWAWFHLAFILSTMPDRHKESREAYQKSIKLSPSDVASHFNLGILYQEVFQQYNQALKCFKKCTTISPQDTASWRCIAFLQRDQFGDSQAAINAFSKVVSLDDKDYESWTILGHLLWEEAKDMKASLSAINKALRLKEDSPWVWCHLGDYYCFGVQDYGSAETAYRKAIEINDSFDWGYAHLGALLLDHRNEAEQAEKYLQKAVDISPSYIFALRELINCKQSLGKPDEEISLLYKKVIEADPGSIDIIIEYAEMLGEKLGQPDEGLAKLMGAFKDAPDHYYLQWSILHYCIYTLGRTQDAAPVISALEEHGESEMGVACLLGSYYACAEGDLERAAVWYGRAIALEPEDHFAVHEYGEFLLYHCKSYSKAIEVLSQAALLDKEYCIGLEGDMLLAGIFDSQKLTNKKQSVTWIEKLSTEKLLQLGNLETAALLLAIFGEKEAALTLSERMITLYPVAYLSWLHHLAYLIMTDAKADLIDEARKKAMTYKAGWVNLDEAVANILKPLNMTGG